MDKKHLQKFEDWRQTYDALTREDHIALWDYIRDYFPEQRAWDLPSVMNFVEWHTPLHVAELGGWDGELAARVLEKCPWIQTWTNWDFANIEPVCKDPRYSVIKEASAITGEVLISSHTLEHLKAKDLPWFFQWSFRALYLDVPLPLTGKPNWTMGHHTHILEWNWEQFDEYLRGKGYALAWDYGKTNYESYARAYTLLV